MSAIIVPTLIIGGLGAIFGVILSIASVIMAVPVDEKEAAIKEALPGANCGACGYPGCDGYAAAVASGSAPVNSCPPGGAAVAQALGAIMGVDAGSTKRQAALIQCAGCSNNTTEKMNYIGTQSCELARQLFGGSSSCAYACLGYGDCADVCDYNAIRIVNGIASVDPALCVGCKLCVKACKKGIIAMAPAEGAAAVACSSKDKGPIVTKACTVGCIGCMKCVKACPKEAISVKDALARIDYEKCDGCGECVASCPRKTIRMM